MMTSQRKSGPCPTCKGSQKKGHLWLTGKDYVVCPDCEGSQVFVCYEERITPKILFPVTRI